MDLLSVWFLLLFSRKPLLLFGFTGLILILLGLVVGWLSTSDSWRAWASGPSSTWSCSWKRWASGFWAWGSWRRWSPSSTTRSIPFAADAPIGDPHGGCSPSAVGGPGSWSWWVPALRPSRWLRWSRPWSRREDELEARLALTGQHDELVDQVLEAFGLVPDLRFLPDFDLALMREGQSLYDLAHGCLDGLTGRRPGLPAPDGPGARRHRQRASSRGSWPFSRESSVGHVEAGLRSGRKWAPFPEEMLRRLTDVLTDPHFAPTPGRGTISSGGDLPADEHSSHGQHGGGRPPGRPPLVLPVGPTNPELAGVLDGDGGWSSSPPTVGSPSASPCAARPFPPFGSLRRPERGIEVLYPVHPNPQVMEPARELLSGHPRIHLTEPLDYLDLVPALEQLGPRPHGLRGASRRRPPPSGPRSWSSGRSPSVPRGWRPASPCWWEPTGIGSFPEARCDSGRREPLATRGAALPRTPTAMERRGIGSPTSWPAT